MFASRRHFRTPYRRSSRAGRALARPGFGKLGFGKFAFGKLTVWLATLCLVGELGSSLHLLLVDHVRCAEHGEWLHEGAQHAQDTEAQASAAATGATLSALADEDGHAHEHCDVIPTWSRTELSEPGSTLSAPWRHLDETPPGEFSALGAARLWLLAPKTSPPSVG